MNTPHDSTDILIDRIAANEAGSSEFAAFEAAAAAEPQAWEQLARALRDELQMRCALSEALGGAELLLTPAVGCDDHRERIIPIWTAAHAWGGWAAAAALALAWLTSFVFVSTSQMQRGAVPAASEYIALPLTADEALDRYLALGQGEGRVIAELPMLMVETHASDDGGLDVYFVRRFLERETVDNVYEYGLDEHGLPTPVRVSPASYVSNGSL